MFIMNNLVNNSRFLSFLLIAILILLVVFWIRKKIKVLNVPNVFLISGAVKTGKTLLSVHLAKKEIKAEKEAAKKEYIALRDKIWQEKWDEFEDRRTEELKEFAKIKAEKQAFKTEIKEEKMQLKEATSSIKGKEKRAVKKKVKENIKNQKTAFKNKIKNKQQEMKLAKKELKKETKQIKKDAKNWYKEYKKSLEIEAKEQKNTPVCLPSDKRIDLKETILNFTVSKNLQAL